MLQQDLSSPPVFHLLVRESAARSPTCCPVGKEGGCSKGQSRPSVPASPSNSLPETAAGHAVPSPFSRQNTNAASTPSTPASNHSIVDGQSARDAIHLTPSALPSPAIPPPAFLGAPGVPPAPQSSWPWPAASNQYFAVQPAVGWGFPAAPASPAAVPLGAAAAAACYEQLHRVYYETYYQAYMAALYAPPLLIPPAHPLSSCKSWRGVLFHAPQRHAPQNA
jgi:hypothetical protein